MYWKHRGYGEKWCRKLSPQYPDVAVDYMFVDNAAMQIILNPKQFDVILTENMFGDIISDEASVISGFTWACCLLHQLVITWHCLNPFMDLIRRQQEKILQTRSVQFYLPQ